MSVTSSLPLTSVTAEDIKQEMIAFLRNYFPGWTDTTDSNNMIVLLEAVGGLSELMYAYINRMGRESFIQYALDPRNVDAHARGMGYIPSAASASTVDGYIYSDKVLTADTPIVQGTKFDTLLPGVVYELVADAVLKANTTVIGPVQFKQQESWNQEFVSTGISTLLVNLNQPQVIPDSIQVYVNGVKWDYVEHFVDSGPSDNHYTYRISTSDYSVVIVFGDGVRGRIPNSGAAGQVLFKAGGGKAGAIPSHYLRNCLSTIRDAGSNAVLNVTADNTYPAAPGGDPETTEQIKKHAPTYLRAPRVLFDLSDVESAVEAVPGVLAVKAVNWEILPSLPHYLIELFILPETAVGGDITPSPALVEAIMTLLTTTRPLVMGNKPMVAGAAYRDLNFNLQVFVKDGYSSTLVKQSITSLLNTLFDPTQTNIWGFVPTFGMPLYSSQLIAILQSIDGVRNLVMVSPTDINLAVNEFPRITSVTFV